MIVEVIVDLAHSQVDKIFDYKTSGYIAPGSRVKVPFAGRVIGGFVIGVKQTSTYPTQKLKEVLHIFDEPPALTQESLSLIKDICLRYKCTTAAAARLFLPTELRRDTARESYISYAKLAFDSIVALETVAKGAKVQREIIKFLEKNGQEDVKVAQIAQDFSRSALKALEQKGIVTITNKRHLRNPYSQLEDIAQQKTLTPSQVNAIKLINASTLSTSLIHGVTGSGKTEVYIRLIKDTISQGKTAIFLVPEISLTPKTLKELRAHFGQKAAILHSGLSAGERFDEWQRLRSGDAVIAVGARSAIFAPLENLGIIVMDEEHDGSYDSESSPRYQTVNIAKMRAQYNNCKLILGSATPSVESYLLASQNEYNLVKMPSRINQMPLPQFIIADMRMQAKRGNNTAFSEHLKIELEKTIKDKNQAIIFLNRRGYAKQIVCASCGYVAACRDCDIALTYHSQDNELKCHYCAKRYKMLTACPECLGKNILYSGTGTQKIVEELKKLFPNCSIGRMDNDTTSKKQGHYQILQDFANKKYDILVGTQMIAKGHDFPSVTLVGILDADMSLNFPDYRSRERTFQLITQVAGRSGRGDEKGVVVLQTYNPSHEILKYAINYDYLSFFNREIALRKALSYPPFSTIVRVMVVSQDKEKAVETLKKVYFSLEELYKNHKDSFVFFNKMYSPLRRLEKKYRMQVLMITTNKALVEQIYQRSSGHLDKDVLVYVEENPGNLS